MDPEDIGQVLDEVGERIGPAGERAFQLTVNYEATLNGILMWPILIAAILLTLLVIASIVNAFSSDYPEGPAAATLIIGVFACGAWILAVTVIAKANNPEYAAMERILNLITGQ